MEGNNQMWNPQQFVSQVGPSGVMGPMYHPPMFLPPIVNQPYQNFPSHFSYPPPHLPPPCLPPSIPPPQPPISQLESVVSTPEIRAISLEAEDKKWVAHWLMQHNVRLTPKEEAASGDKQLVHTRDVLLKCLSVIKELRTHHHEMSAHCDFISDTEWDESLTRIEQKKNELALLLSKLRSLDMSSVQRKLSKRAKKRDRLRRKRVRCREVQQAVEARRKTLHQRADAWLAEMRLTVEREHREEELRREADAVLSEVTRKQTEAKRQIALLDALIKLRGARAQRAAAHSSSQDAEADRSAKKFATVIERLRKLWNAQLKEYATEEHGLRVMLQESADQKRGARFQRARSAVEQWRKAIFGESGARHHVEQNIDELVAVRQEWDSFVVPVGFVAPVASSIPVGWVLPHGPTSASWRRYCVAYDTSE